MLSVMVLNQQHGMQSEGSMRLRHRPLGGP